MLHILCTRGFFSVLVNLMTAKIFRLRLACLTIFFSSGFGSCTDISWTKVVQQSTHDDLVPTGGGFEPDVIVASQYDCLSLCEANKNCMGFVFVSSTYVCQLYQATWDNSVAVTTVSARFYIIAGKLLLDFI